MKLIVSVCLVSLLLLAGVDASLLRRNEVETFECGNAHRRCYTGKEECVTTNDTGENACVCKVGSDRDVSCMEGRIAAGTDPTLCPCLDIDECTQSSPDGLPAFPCPDGSFCVDYDPPERYKCECKPGFDSIYPERTLDPVPVEWRPVQCLNIDECLDNPCHPTLANCEDFEGAYKCTCIAGYEGDGVTCVTEEEPPTLSQEELCLAANCNKNTQQCVTDEMDDSVVCGCKDGYKPTISGDGQNDGRRGCEDINECTTDPYPCDPNAECNNYPGFFICLCNPGFKGPIGGPCTALTPSPTTAVPTASPTTPAPVTPSPTPPPVVPRPLVSTTPAPAPAPEPAPLVFVNEVADVATGGSCSTAEWIELYNTGPATMTLSGWILRVRQGSDSDDAFMFGEGFEIGPDEYLVLCSVDTFNFTLQAQDIVTLLDEMGTVVSTSGALKSMSSDSMTYQRKPDGSYDYAPPTEGSINIFPIESVVFSDINDGDTIDTSGVGFATGVTGSFCLQGSAPSGTTAIIVRILADDDTVEEEGNATIVGDILGGIDWKIEINALRSGKRTILVEAIGPFGSVTSTLTVTIVSPSDDAVLMQPAFAFTAQFHDRLTAYDISQGMHVFSSDLTGSLNVGDGLASEPIDGIAPDGYLRIITGIEFRDGSTFVTTRQAGLAEFFRRIALNFTSESETEESTSIALGGVRQRRHLLKLGDSEQTELTLNINFDPGFSLDIDVGWERGDSWYSIPKPTLQKFSFETELVLKGEFALTHTFAGAEIIPRRAFGPEVEGTFGRIVIPTPVGVPIVVNLEFETGLFFSLEIAAILEVEYSPELSFKAGYEYLSDGSGRGGYTENTSSANNIDIDLGGELTAIVESEVEVQALFYGAVGIEVECTPQLVFTAVIDVFDNECKLKLLLTIPFEAGIEIEIDFGPFEKEIEFDVTLLTISATLFEDVTEKRSPTSSPTNRPSIALPTSMPSVSPSMETNEPTDSCTGCSLDEECCDGTCIGMEECCPSCSSPAFCCEGRCTTDECCGSTDPCCGDSDPCCTGCDESLAQGDPHLYTFDRLHYSCQGRGEFILMKSMTSGAQVQARFEKTASDFVSLATAVVAYEGPGTDTTVQMSIPGYPDYDVFVNNIQLDPLPTYDDGKVSITTQGSKTTIIFAATGLTVEVKFVSLNFFPHFSIKIRLPSGFRNEQIGGLLGSPDDNPRNDWMKSNGDILDIPTFGLTGQAAWNYCTTHWCIRDEADSLFNTDTLPFLNRCDEGYPGPVVLTRASLDVRNLCGSGAACLIDGIELGIDGAQEVLEGEASLGTRAPLQAFFVFPTAIQENTIVTLTITINLENTAIDAASVSEFEVYQLNSDDIETRITGVIATIQRLGATSNTYSGTFQQTAGSAGDRLSFEAVSGSGISLIALNAVISFSEISGVGVRGDPNDVSVT